MTCPICKGEGEFIEDIIDGVYERKEPCIFCKEKGKIGLFKYIHFTFAVIWWRIYAD